MGPGSRPGSEAPGGAQEERTVPEAACGGRGEAIRRGAAQTSTVQPHACKEKARNLIRGRLRPKFQPQRGVTGWRPTGACQLTALSPFPSCFGSPGRRDHGESLTCRETSTYRPGGPASPASLCPASASKLGPQVAPLQPRTPDHAQPPRSRSRISLTGHGTAGRFLLMAAGSPRAPWTTPARGPHQRPPTLSLSPPALPMSLAGRHVGVRKGKGFVEADGSRSGRNPKCSEQGGQCLQARRWRRPRRGRQSLRWACWALEHPCQAHPAELSPLPLCTPESEPGAEGLDPGGKAANPPF